MALKPMMLADSRAKKEHCLMVIVPAGPIETAEVSEILPAEPMRIMMASNWGMKAYLACRRPFYFHSPSPKLVQSGFRERTSQICGQWRYQKWR